MILFQFILHWVLHPCWVWCKFCMGAVPIQNHTKPAQECDGSCSKHTSCHWCQYSVLHNFSIALILHLSQSHLHLQFYKLGQFLFTVSIILQKSFRIHRCLGGMVGFTSPWNSVAFGLTLQPCSTFTLHWKISYIVWHWQLPQLQLGEVWLALAFSLLTGGKSSMWPQPSML